MNATFTLLDMAGYIALLLWGLQLMQSSILQACGGTLRYFLSIALKSRIKALGFGFAATLLLQSASAVNLMTATFTAGGLIDLAPALALMLGANIGGTCLVQLFAFDISRVAPLLVLLGVTLLRRKQPVMRQLANVLIGMGLMLFALKQLVMLLHAAGESEALRLLLTIIAKDDVLDTLLSAVLAWAMHSSAAVVLLAMSLATQHLVSLNVAFALVLGANLGSAVNPLLESGKTGNPASRRLPVGNVINRLTGCLLVLPLLAWSDKGMPTLFTGMPAHAIANFHTLFNLGMALLFFPFIGSLTKLLRKVLKDRALADDPAQAHYLDPRSRATPRIAIANAAREALRMADMVEAMLGQALLAIEKGERPFEDIRKADHVLEQLNRQIKTYVSGLPQADMNEEDRRRADDVLGFAINMKDASGILAHDWVSLAMNKAEQHVVFPQQESDSLRGIAQRVMDNTRLASTVFMTRELRGARQLLEEKVFMRDEELRAKHRYFLSLREGQSDAVEGCALQLELLRQLKRINSHVASSALSVLEEQGKAAVDAQAPVVATAP